MFSNTVKLTSNDGTDHTVETVIIDGPSNMKTLRASADGKTVLAIAHQSSNENPGFTTQRSTVRVTKEKSSDDSDATTKCYVQLTTSVPKDQWSAAELATLVSQLVNFIFSAENGSANVSAVDAEVLAVPRIYAGEP
jgi:hypothetical protein